MSNLKYKVGDRVLIKDIGWYNDNKNILGNVECGDALMTFEKARFCGKIVTISNISDVTDTYGIEEDNGLWRWTDEMIECKVEEETPKFKVNDIVFVKSIGWVRITNGYWDSFANEYIYEAIGFNGEGEYDCISQSNIECQMLPESESENPHTGGNKITLEEYKNNDKEWLFNKLAMLDNITALESIQDIFNHLQQPKYPKSYEECCKILGCIAGYVWGGYKGDLIKTFHMLYICRDAYWQIAGEEMGLGKPWEPDWRSLDPQYIILYQYGSIDKAETHGEGNYILTFPTAEMRDAFYKYFEEEIEMCKELL